MRTLIIAAFAGFASAALVDLNAYIKAKETAGGQEAPEPEFEWPLAIKRWISGAITGLVAALSTEVQP